MGCHDGLSWGGRGVHFGQVSSKESNIDTYRNGKGAQLLQFYTFRFIAVSSSTLLQQ